METIIIVATVLQGIAISLGMGSSTLAITNFFVAIADGKIDPTERKMMGVVYVFLRIAMLLILATTLVLIGINYFWLAQAAPLAFLPDQSTLIAVLFLNSWLMTKRLMSSKFGPAIQASTWYTLGIITALLPLGLPALSYGQFLLGYIAVIVSAIVLVNGLMSYLKKD